jgi:hypothetical protein
MSDEQNVDAGSETSGEEAAAPSQEETAAETATTASEPTASERAAAADLGETAAGGAADETSEPVAPDTDASRTGFAEKGLRAGDECKCPDGRTGTVHSFDAGFVCIPNADQG